jgi:hypothetical protein
MKEVTRNEVATFFKLPPRQAYLLCARWLRDGFLVVGDPSTKRRSYRLAAKYEDLVAGQSPPQRSQGNKPRAKRGKR